MNINEIFAQDRIILHPEVVDRVSLLHKMTAQIFPDADESVESYRLVLDANKPEYGSLSHGALLFFFETTRSITAQGSLAILKETVDWDDDSPDIGLVFVIVYSKDNPQSYLDFLSQLSRMLSRKTNYERLLTASSCADAWEVFIDDNVLLGRSNDRRMHCQDVAQEKRGHDERRV